MNTILINKLPAKQLEYIQSAFKFYFLIQKQFRNIDKFTH